MKTSLFLSIVAFLVWAGCSLFDTNGSADDPEPRIVFGESLEGLRIGDDSTTVVETLGAPDEMAQDDFNGDIFRYTEGELALTEVAVSRDSGLGLGVIDVRVSAPYGGRTKGGTGVGTPRGEAVAELGEPDTVLERSTGTLEIYLFESNIFKIDYREGMVFSIHMRALPPN